MSDTSYYEHLSIPQKAVARTYDQELQNIQNHAKIRFMDHHSEVSEKKIEIDVQGFEEICLEGFRCLERKNASIPNISDIMMKINTISKGDETLKGHIYALIDLSIWTEKVIEFAFVSEERVKYIAQILQKYHEMYTEAQDLKSSRNFISVETLKKKIQNLRGPRKTRGSKEDTWRNNNKRTTKSSPPVEEGSDSVKRPAAAGDTSAATGDTLAAAGDTSAAAGDTSVAAGDTSVAVKDPPAAVKDPPAAVKDPPVAVKDPPAAVKDPPVAVKDPPVAVKDPPAAAGDPLVVKESTAAGGIPHGQPDLGAAGKGLIAPAATGRGSGAPAVAGRGSGAPAVAGRGSGPPASAGRGSGAPAVADGSKKRKGRAQTGDQWASNIFRPSRIDDDQTLEYDETGDACDEEKFYVKGANDIDSFLDATRKKVKETKDAVPEDMEEYEKLTAEDRERLRSQRFNTLNRR